MIASTSPALKADTNLSSSALIPASSFDTFAISCSFLVCALPENWISINNNNSSIKALLFTFITGIRYLYLVQKKQYKYHSTFGFLNSNVITMYISILSTLVRTRSKQLAG